MQKEQQKRRKKNANEQTKLKRKCKITNKM